MKRFYFYSLVGWLVLFTAEAWNISRWAYQISGNTNKEEGLALDLGRASQTQRETVRQIHAQSKELEFLQTLPNLLPQDKGYLRTQKAISEEVQDLRGKLRSQLKGSLYVIVDAKANKLYLKKGFQILLAADCSVGRGGQLVDKKTGRHWEFVTPSGEFQVKSKAENPLWKKPDWAFVEAKQPIPPPEDPTRLVAGELGAYLFNLGDGYLIHGTKDEAVLGRPASHGCVRLGADDLKKLYAMVPVGTKVFIIY